MRSPGMPLVLSCASVVLSCASVLLAQGQDAADRERATAHVAMLEQAYTERLGSQAAEWRERVRTEEPALLASLDWLIRNGQGVQALRLSVPLAYFRNLQGRSQEARELLTRVLAAPGAAAPTAIRAKALYDAGLIAFRQRDQAGSRSLNEESLSIYRQLQDKPGMATALVGLSRVALRDLDHAAVRAYAEESAALRRDSGDKRGEATALHMLAASARMQGQYGRAAELYEFSLAVNQEAGNQAGVAGELFNLGYVRLRQGQIGNAKKLFSESLAGYRALRDQAGIAYNLGGFAAVAAEEQQPERAARLYGAASAVLDTLKITLDPDDQLEVDHYSAKVRNELGPARFDAATAEGRLMPLEGAITLALGRS